MEKKEQAKVSQFSIVDTKEWNDEVRQRRKKSDVVNYKDCTDPDPKTT